MLNLGRIKLDQKSSLTSVALQHLVVTVLTFRFNNYEGLKNVFLSPQAVNGVIFRLETRCLTEPYSGSLCRWRAS